MNVERLSPRFRERRRRMSERRNARKRPIDPHQHRWRNLWRKILRRVRLGFRQSRRMRRGFVLFDFRFDYRARNRRTADPQLLSGERCWRRRRRRFRERGENRRLPQWRNRRHRTLSRRKRRRKRRLQHRLPSGRGRIRSDNQAVKRNPPITGGFLLPCSRSRRARNRA